MGQTATIALQLAGIIISDISDDDDSRGKKNPAGTTEKSKLVVYLHLVDVVFESVAIIASETSSVP